MRTLSSLGNLTGKTVLVRCDLNVPVKDGVIGDDGRIRASLDTINRLRSGGAKVVILSHLGRPEARAEAKFSLKPVAHRLSELLGSNVMFVSETIGEQAAQAIARLQPGEVLLLENVRFNEGETSKDSAIRRAFAQEIAALGDVFVSDGFGVVHREQASVTDLAELLPSAAGLLVERELTVLERLTRTPERPYTVVLGGSKVSDKLGVIHHLLDKVDTILIGGGMLFTFLAAKGYPVGASLLEADQIETVRGYVAKAQELGVAIEVPTDVVVAATFNADAQFEVVAADQIEQSTIGKTAVGLDIGPETAQRYADIIRRSRTVFWNGPMGVFEFENFARGTATVARALTECQGLTVVGGGDSAAAVRALGFSDSEFGHISTGGGASLEFLEGRTLPGLAAIGWT